MEVAQAVTHTLQYIIANEAEDQVLEGGPTTRAIIKRGGKHMSDGGRRFDVPIRLAQNTTGKWMGGSRDSLNQTPQDNLNTAQFSISTLTATESLTDEEAAFNSGKEQILNLARTKSNFLMEDMLETFNTKFFTAAANAAEPWGLPDIVSTSNPSIGNVGGIDRTEFSSWQAGQVYSTANTLDPLTMGIVYSNCTHGMNYPDLIPTTRTLFSVYEDLVRDHQQVKTGEDGDLGFPHLYFRSSEIFWDAACTASGMYFLNSKKIQIWCVPNGAFQVTPTVRSETKLLESWAMVWRGAVVVTSPRHSGSILNAHE